MHKIQQDLSLVSMRIVATTSDQRKAKRNTTHTRTVTHMALYQMSIRFAQMPTMDRRQPIKLLYELTKWIWHTTVIEKNKHKPGLFARHIQKYMLTNNVAFMIISDALKFTRPINLIIHARPTY
jgi:hypothetical protein